MWRISPPDNLSCGQISPHDRIFLHGHRPWCPWLIWGMSGHQVVTKWPPSSYHFGTLLDRLGTLLDHLVTSPDHSVPYQTIWWPYRGILVRLVICVIPGHWKLKILNMLKYRHIDSFSAVHIIHDEKKMIGHLIWPIGFLWSEFLKIWCPGMTNWMLDHRNGLKETCFCHIWAVLA